MIGKMKLHGIVTLYTSCSLPCSLYATLHIIKYCFFEKYPFTTLRQQLITIYKPRIIRKKDRIFDSKYLRTM